MSISATVLIHSSTLFGFFNILPLIICVWLLPYVGWAESGYKQEAGMSSKYVHKCWIYYCQYFWLQISGNTTFSSVLT